MFRFTFTLRALQENFDPGGAFVPPELSVSPLSPTCFRLFSFPSHFDIVHVHDGAQVSIPILELSLIQFLSRPIRIVASKAILSMGVRTNSFQAVPRAAKLKTTPTHLPTIHSPKHLTTFFFKKKKKKTLTVLTARFKTVHFIFAATRPSISSGVPPFCFLQETVGSVFSRCVLLLWPNS